MGEVIGSLLPLAVGVAISPIPIIAVIMMLLSSRAKTASVGFAAGWLAGIVVVTVILVLVSGQISTSDSGPSAVVSWIKIVLGVLLLGLAAKQWTERNDEHPTPKWMSAIDSITAPKAAGLGFVLSAVNPKNLMMCVAAGVLIGSASLPGGEATIAVVVYTLIGSCTVVLPVIAYLVASDRMSGPLSSLKAWLQANNAAVMLVLVLVIGVVLLGKGIGGLA